MSDGFTFDEEKFEEAVRKLGYVDFDYAMECCAESVELYVSLLKGYLFNDFKLKSLCEYYDSKDWDNYRVSIHAVKSSSLLLGIRGLSAKAKKLEFAVKEEDIDFVLSNHDDAMQEYRQVAEDLKGLLSDFGL